MQLESTAKHGNPRQASRGAAKRRALSAFGDAVTDALNPRFIAMEQALTCDVIGCTPAELPGRLRVATLAELEQWTAAVEGAAK